MDNEQTQHTELMKNNPDYRTAYERNRLALGQKLTIEVIVNDEFLASSLADTLFNDSVIPGVYVTSLHQGHTATALDQLSTQIDKD